MAYGGAQLEHGLSSNERLLVVVLDLLPTDEVLSAGAPRSWIGLERGLTSMLITCTARLSSPPFVSRSANHRHDGQPHVASLSWGRPTREGSLTFADGVVAPLLARDDYISQLVALLPPLWCTLSPPVPVEHAQNPVGCVSATPGLTAKPTVSLSVSSARFG